MKEMGSKGISLERQMADSSPQMSTPSTPRFFYWTESFVILMSSLSKNMLQTIYFHHGMSCKKAIENSYCLLFPWYV